MLLRAGVLVPFLYFGTVILASFFYPGYSHVRQYASELGSSAARYPALFNAGILLTGAALIAAAAAFPGALRKLRANRTLSWLFVVTVAGFGIGMVMGALFPMPDPRHGGFGLGMGIHIAPALLGAALWKDPDARTLRIYLFATTIAGIAMFAIMMGVGGFVTRANVGVFQRAYAIALIPWIGVASHAILKRSAAIGIARGGEAGVPVAVS